MNNFRKLLNMLTTIVLLVVLINTYLYQIASIPTDSMAPTIDKSTFVLIQKFNKDPIINDIVALYPPSVVEDREYYIKRVVALADDTIEVKNGKLFRNGIVVPSDIVMEYSIPRTIVPTGKVFVLGDNRNDSYDSSVWGYLETDHVVGKIVYIFK